MLREKVTHEYIIRREEEVNKKVFSRLSKISNLILIGHKTEHRIPIYSFVVKFKGKLYHYNFISSLLNDLFGIQSRGGCACASTYGQRSLGLNEETIENLEKLVVSGSEIFRPGYTRINFPYFYEDYLIDYILDSIEFVAKNGYKFLSHYAFKIESGKFYHRNTEEEKRKWLNQIDFEDEKIIIPKLIKEDSLEEDLDKDKLDKMFLSVLQLTENIKSITKHIIGKSKINHKIIFSYNENERWFLLNDDIEDLFYDKDNNKEVEEKIMKYKIDKLNIKFEMEQEIVEIIDEIKEKIIAKEIFNENSNIINDKLENNHLNSEEDINQIEILDFGKSSKKVLQNTVLFPE